MRGMAVQSKQMLGAAQCMTMVRYPFCDIIVSLRSVFELYFQEIARLVGEDGLLLLKNNSDSFSLRRAGLYTPNAGPYSTMALHYRLLSSSSEKQTVPRARAERSTRMTL